MSFLSLIQSSLCKSRLNFRWNKFNKVLYISQTFSAPTRTIFVEENNQIANIYTTTGKNSGSHKSSRRSSKVLIFFFFFVCEFHNFFPRLYCFIP